MAIVYVLPPAGGLQNTGYANGRTYTSNGGVIAAPDFDAAVLINQGWTELSAGDVATSGGGVGLKAVGVLGQSAVPASVTGTSVETTLGSLIVPGGLLGPNGSLRISAQWTLPNSATTKTLRAYFGGTLIFQLAATTQGSVTIQKFVRNRNATNVQSLESQGNAGPGTSGAGSGVGAIDTTVNQSVIFTTALGTTTDTVTLEAYLVEILNP